MDAILIFIVIVGLIALAAGAYLYQRNRRTEQLRERFGAEYERTIESEGRIPGERDLAHRAERVEKLEIHELTAEDRTSFLERWKEVQADFVDRPETAILSADNLVQEVMAARGYPVADFEQRAKDLSVQHAGVIEHYREAHRISELHRESPRSTEELRQAMIHYRALFSDLLGEVAARR